MLCSWEAANLIPIPMHPQLLLLTTHLFYLYTHQSCKCNSGHTRPSSKSNKEIVLFQNYSVLSCGPSSTFHSWDYSPHCCIQWVPCLLAPSELLAGFTASSLLKHSSLCLLPAKPACLDFLLTFLKAPYLYFGGFFLL